MLQSSQFVLLYGFRKVQALQDQVGTEDEGFEEGDEEDWVRHI